MIEIDPAKIILTPVEVRYLKMEVPPVGQFRQLEEVSFYEWLKPVDEEEYLHHYYHIGFKLQWLDRYFMDRQELKEKLNAPNVRIFLMKMQSTDAGLLELILDEDYVELLYFGLYPEFVGKGLGRFFLDWSIRKAWSFKPKWIQLNTCALDHPNAFPIYKKLGFIHYKSTVEERRSMKE